MMEFHDGVLSLHRVGKGCREFKSWLASIIMIVHFSLADQEHVNTAQVVELDLENQQDTILSFTHCSGVICENCTQHCPCRTGIQQSVCMVGTKMREGGSQKVMFAGALSLLQSFERVANRFPQAMVT
jgi:hypothetical protein